MNSVKLYLLQDLNGGKEYHTKLPLFSSTQGIAQQLSQIITSLNDTMSLNCLYSTGEFSVLLASCYNLNVILIFTSLAVLHIFCLT